MTAICIVIFIGSNFNIKRTCRKSVIRSARKLLSNISKKAIIFESDLSWTDDYLDVIEKVSNENKIVEIFLPVAKFVNTSNKIAENALYDRINRLNLIGAKMYLTKRAYHIRCIITGPDIIAQHKRMQMFMAERIKRNVKNVS